MKQRLEKFMVTIEKFNRRERIINELMVLDTIQKTKELQAYADILKRQLAEI